MNDPELQRRFAGLREQEAAQAPSFDRVWAAAARRQFRHAAPTPWGVRLTVAGFAAALIAVAFWLGSGHEDTQPVPTAQAWERQLASLETEIAALDLADWQAPTDFLLTSNP